MNRFDTHEVVVRQFLLIVLSEIPVVAQSAEKEPLAEQYECVESGIRAPLLRRVIFAGESIAKR